MIYQLINECIVRITDNAFIPLDPANTDYQEYLAWVEEGNTPQPADTLPEPTPAPNWIQFSNFLLAESSILAKLSSSSLFSALMLSLQNVAVGGSVDTVRSLWNSAEYSFTTTERSKLNKAFKDSNISIKVTTSGKLEPV